MGSSESHHLDDVPVESSDSTWYRIPTQFDEINSTIQAQRLVFAFAEDNELYDKVCHLLQKFNPMTSAKSLSLAMGQYPHSLDKFLNLARDIDSPPFRSSLLDTIMPYSMAYLHDHDFFTTEECVAAIYRRLNSHSASNAIPRKFFRLFGPEIAAFETPRLKKGQVQALCSVRPIVFLDAKSKRRNDFASELQLSIYNDNVTDLREIVRTTPEFDFDQTCTIPFFDFAMALKNTEIPIISFAALCGSIQCFKFLLINGSNPQQSSFPSRFMHDNALFWAIMGGNYEIMRVLEEQSIPFVYATTAAVLSHRNDTLVWLIQTKNVPIDDRICGYNSFIYSLITNNLEASMILAEADCRLIDFALPPDSPINRFNVVLRLLASKGNSEAITLVLQMMQSCGKDLKINTESYAYTAISSDQLLPLKALAQMNVKKPFGRYALHLAAEFDVDDIAEFLLAQGYSVSRHDAQMNTPIEVCCQNDSAKVGRLLLKHGADVNQMSNLNRSPLYLCIVSNSPTMARLLIENGADPSVANNGGVTPLHLACEQGSMEMVRLLTTHGADAKAQTNFRWTPLHYACMSGKLDVVQYLLDLNVERDIIDTDGHDPIYYADLKQFGSIVNLLRS